MKLLLIRHGESEADILGVHEGRADFELTERGHRQAEAMAAYIKENYTVSAIYCSTLKRALQTAAHLSSQVAIPLNENDMLREFNNGLLAGLDWETADRKYPRVPDVPIHTSVYEQESALEFRFRADYMLSKIISENDNDAVIAVVAHGGMINQLYRSFLRLPVDSNIRFATGDTGIHEWLITDDYRAVVKANEMRHTNGL